jgi:asparagine synthase (glutamine-hydrolysing)
MCGIAGVLHRDGTPVDERLVRRMTDILAHRGPDGEGFYVRDPVGLGHRRLAIIDLASGAQPMAAAQGGAWITYNGEVYNYRDLRRELVGRGCEFRTTSDTEVVLAAYQTWGVDCLSRLRGMFAFAIWDERRRRLFLARDRVGIKPLVYAWDGRRLRFASEIKALLQDPSLPKELDWDGLRDYLTYLYVPGEQTIFRGIRKLPPAGYLVCDVDGGPPEVGTYWDLRMCSEQGVSEAEWAARLEDALREAVRLHMVSDVPVGAFLSGGLDSSSVVACMAQVASGPVKTYSIGFDEEDYDELFYARQVAKRYGTEHFEMIVKPDVVDVVPKLAWQFDEPFGDVSAIPTYCVSKITREHVTVALSGDGGDESFAGYRRYARAAGLRARMDRTALALAKPFLRWAGARRSPGARGREFLRSLGMSSMERYQQMITYQSAESLDALLTRQSWAELRRRPGVEPTGETGSAGPVDYVSALQYRDVHGYLPGDILTKVDRTSMLTSLETRVPLLDHVVMELAGRIPSTLKLRNGTGKHIFKEAMRRHLPDDVRLRRKMGFGVPLGSWLRTSLRDFACDILSESVVRQRGVLQPAAVTKLLEQHLSGRRDNSSQLWSFMCLELWFRTWWDR